MWGGTCDWYRDMEWALVAFSRGLRCGCTNSPAQITIGDPDRSFSGYLPDVKWYKGFLDFSGRLLSSMERKGEPILGVWAAWLDYMAREGMKSEAEWSWGGGIQWHLLDVCLTGACVIPKMVVIWWVKMSVKILHWGACKFLPKNFSKFKFCFPTLAFSLPAESKKCLGISF